MLSSKLFVLRIGNRHNVLGTDVTGNDEEHRDDERYDDERQGSKIASVKSKQKPQIVMPSEPMKALPCLEESISVVITNETFSRHIVIRRKSSLAPSQTVYRNQLVRSRLTYRQKAS